MTLRMIGMEGYVCCAREWSIRGTDEDCEGGGCCN